MPLLALTMVVACQGTTLLKAQAPPAFEEEKRITAIDVVVGLEVSGFKEWATGKPVPKDLAPGDFEVLYDGEPRTVIAVSQEAADWTFVIVFDALLSSTKDLRWAATVLAEHSAGLAELGDVEIVIIDREPRVRLPSTRNAEHIERALSTIAQTLEGSDELQALRAEVAVEIERPETELTADDLRDIATAEERLVRQRLDDLLLLLAERSPAGPHRAVWLASGGFDTRPEVFYNDLLPDVELPQSLRIATAVDTLAQTLAAYGWTTFHLRPPAAKALIPGIRIGKLRLTKPGFVYDETYNRTVFNFFGGVIEENRKPRRAEAYLELGQALEGQGKLEEAEEALRKAIYHFGKDPRTADKQAVAFARLAKILDVREEKQAAAAALDLARRLDPQGTVTDLGSVGRLLDPATPLGEIARVTTGGDVRAAPWVGNILEELGRRVRLTYQVAGQPDGKLHRLDVRSERAERVIHPVWARSATPVAVAVARLRRLGEGEPTGGSLALDVEREGDLARIDLVRSDSTARLDDKAVLRLTLGYGGPEIQPTIEHHDLGLPASTNADLWSFEQAITPPADASWLAVLVEDLETGLWGGRLVDLGYD